MDWILYLLLALALVGDVLLAVLLVRSGRKPPRGDTADDFVRAMTPVLQGETDLLAEQLRAMQGEMGRTTTATLRDFSSVLAENQRQSAAASTARLESIDRAGAARQKAANDALLAQLPLTVEVEDYSTNEKIFYPPQALDTADAPPAEGGTGTLAYYAPWGDVVMFYGDYNASSSLYELGQAVSGGDLVGSLSGAITLTAVS